MMNKRAQSVSDAINLYEDYKYKKKIEDMHQQQLELQKQNLEIQKQQVRLQQQQMISRRR